MSLDTMIRPEEMLSLKERLERAKRDAQPLIEVEAQDERIAQTINDFLSSRISLDEFLQDYSEDLPPGTVEFVNLDEMRSCLVELLRDEALADELTHHEKEHWEQVQEFGWQAKLLFRFFRDEQNALSGRPGVQPKIPRTGDEDEIRRKLKLIIEAAHDPSDTDTLATR